MKNISLEHLQRDAQLRREGGEWLYACTVAALLSGLLWLCVAGHAWVSGGLL